MSSVKDWAEQNFFQYHFLGDEFFGYLNPNLVEKTQQQKVIATDLARLKACQDFLNQGFARVIWCDADFLIFSPSQLILPEVDDLPEGYALGREVWVQQDSTKQDSETNTELRAYKKVHNAFMLFQQGNSFLDFYADHAERLLERNSGRMPPQFIGPKLLTALHNVIQCPVIETAGMFSPLVIKDALNGRGPALELFIKRSPQLVAGANLCSSLAQSAPSQSNKTDTPFVSSEDITDLIQKLLNSPEIFTSELSPTT